MHFFAARNKLGTSYNARFRLYFLEDEKNSCSLREWGNVPNFARDGGFNKRRASLTRLRASDQSNPKVLRTRVNGLMVVLKFWLSCSYTLPKMDYSHSRVHHSKIENAHQVWLLCGQILASHHPPLSCRIFQNIVIFPEMLHWRLRKCPTIPNIWGIYAVLHRKESGKKTQPQKRHNQKMINPEKFLPLTCPSGKNEIAEVVQNALHVRTLVEQGNYNEQKARLNKPLLIFHFNVSRKTCSYRLQVF